MYSGGLCQVVVETFLELVREWTWLHPADGSNLVMTDGNQSSSQSRCTSARLIYLEVGSSFFKRDLGYGFPYDDLVRWSLKFHPEPLVPINSAQCSDKIASYKPVGAKKSVDASIEVS